MENINYQEMYSRLVDAVQSIYKSNLKRIHKGLWTMITVLVLYLVLLFVTQGEKTIILLLWIVTMFAIAAYLITLEYLNEELKKMLEHITQQEHDFGPAVADVIAEEELAALRGLIAAPKPISDAIAARLNRDAKKASETDEAERSAPDMPDAGAEKPAAAAEENAIPAPAAEECVTCEDSGIGENAPDAADEVPCVPAAEENADAAEAPAPEDGETKKSEAEVCV